MKTNILLVEDSLVQRIAIIELLQEHGYEVEAAEDGVEALRLLESSRRVPDLVITDIGMPNMNGINLCRRIKRNPSMRHLPVIVLTNLEDERNHRQAVEAGSDEFLVKPIGPAELLLRVEWVLSLARRGARDELRRHKELFEAIPDAVLVADKRGHYIEANTAAFDLLGYSRAELLKLDAKTLSLQPDAWTDNHRWVGVVGAWRGRDRMRRKDGVAVSVDAHVRSALLDGQPVYVSVLRKAV